MSQVINTNIASLNAQRNLNSSQGAYNTALQRLSSGLRINSAKDDAAGMAISSRMTTQVKGLNVAARNANDAISLAQTAEGALNSVTDNLQRMRELAVQSSNATNNSADRLSLDNEVQQLKQEIDRVASQTAFNGTKLLDGSFSGAVFQVGANAGETISLSGIVNAQTTSLGGTYTMNVSTVAASAITGFATAVAAGGITIDGPTSAAGVDIGPLAAAGNASERAGQLASAINAVSQQTGVSAYYDAGTGNLSLMSTGAVTIGGSVNDATVAGFANGATTPAASTTTLSTLNVQGFAAAQAAIGMIDQALASVNSTRATLGAIQNRFESTITNLQTGSENISAARSRILDADYAAETANLTRAQILQQAGTAMLSQANSAPQNVLSLLK